MKRWKVRVDNRMQLGRHDAEDRQVDRDELFRSLALDGTLTRPLNENSCLCVSMSTAIWNGISVFAMSVYPRGLQTVIHVTF
jgi:hypothetical protein